MKDNLIIWINIEIWNGVNSIEGIIIVFILNLLDVFEIKRELYMVNNDFYGVIIILLILLIILF